MCSRRGPTNHTFNLTRISRSIRTVISAHPWLCHASLASARNNEHKGLANRTSHYFNSSLVKQIYIQSKLRKSSSEAFVNLNLKLPGRPIYARTYTRKINYSPPTTKVNYIKIHGTVSKILWSWWETDWEWSSRSQFMICCENKDWIANNVIHNSCVLISCTLYDVSGNCKFTWLDFYST